MSRRSAPLAWLDGLPVARRGFARSLALASLVTLATAAVALDEAAERQRIAVERQQVQARYRAESAGCASRFVVTACEDEARARRRADLERLQAQQARLDDARRQRRASDRQQRIEQQLQRDALRAEGPAAASAGMRPAARVRVRPAKEAASTPVPARHAPARATTMPVDRPDDARRAQDATQRREREAAAHRADVEARNAEQARRKPAAAPLPPPGASRP